MARLTWSRAPKERGSLPSERGFILKHAGHPVGRTGVVFEGFSRKKRGYYWYASVNGQSRNTASTPVATEDEAKEQCLAFVKKYIGR